MGVDHGRTGGPLNLELGTLMQIAPPIDFVMLHNFKHLHYNVEKCVVLPLQQDFYSKLI